MPRLSCCAGSVLLTRSHTRRLGPPVGLPSCGAPVVVAQLLVVVPVPRVLDKVVVPIPP